MSLTPEQPKGSESNFCISDIIKEVEELTGAPPGTEVSTFPLGELPPQARRPIFGRNSLVDDLVGLAENLKHIALVGAVGIGKTAVALTLLHHPRIEQRFGQERRFIRCDKFSASCTDFLAQLSKVIGAEVENPRSLESLRPFLSSKLMLIVLDNAESILCPKGMYAEEICSLVQELCQFENIFLCITSHIATVPQGWECLTIPPFSMDAACEFFYSIYQRGGGSSIVKGIVEHLGCHALSIEVVATLAEECRWNDGWLRSEWKSGKLHLRRTLRGKSLECSIQPLLTSPIFRSLGPYARELLGVFTFFPQGITEADLIRLFPHIPNIKVIFNGFCILSLAYRSDGFIKMLAPFRFLFSPSGPGSSPLPYDTKQHLPTALNHLAT